MNENMDLLEDLNEMPLFDDERIYKVHYLIWVGPGGTHTGLHIDTDPMSLLLQIHGKKELKLFPPQQSEYIYPSSKYDYGAVLSKVDFQHIDFETFPLMNLTKPMNVILQPGDALFVPSGWFHTVNSLTESISLSVRAETICEYYSYFFLDLIHALHNMGLYKKGNCVCHSKVHMTSLIKKDL